MSLTQLGGEYNNAPYIFRQISEYIIKELNIKEEIKQLLQEKITPIKDHLKRLIDNPTAYYGQGAANFSNVIKEKLFALPKNHPDFYFFNKEYPFIRSERLLELLTRVDNKDFDVSDSTYYGFVVTREGDKLEYNTGIDIGTFISKNYTWTDCRLYIDIKKYTKVSTEIRDAYIAEITKIIEAKIKNITVPTDISENDAHKPAEPLSPANDAVVEKKENPTTGGQRRNRKSKKARKTKKDRKSRKNRRKSNRRRR